MAKNKKTEDGQEDSVKVKKQPQVNNIEELLKMVDQNFGDGTIILGRNNTVLNIKSIPTGIPTIDIAIGCGGIPRGRIIEIFGAESSGKTTTCLQLIKACQKHYFEDKKRYGVVAFIDAEHALDIEWASKIGVDINKLIISQPDNGDQAFDIIKTLVQSKLIDMVVVDSVAALIPKKQLEGDISDNTIGDQARLMSKGLNALKGKCSTCDTTVLFVNQVREKIGVMFGDNETTPGGRALRFYSSVRCKITKGSQLKDGDTVVGFTPKLSFIKNKVAPPFTNALYTIYVGQDGRYGIDEASALLKTAVDFKLVTRNGSHYRYNDVILGNGESNASKFLNQNKETFDEIKKLVYSQISVKNTMIDQEDILEEIDDDSLEDFPIEE